jgi:hypothetical protein
MMHANTCSQCNVLCIIFSNEYEVLIFLCPENHNWEQHKTTIILKLYNTELNFVNWYVRVCAEETDTIPVLFSVEARFHCSEYVNIQHKILMYVPCILHSFFLSRTTNLLVWINKIRIKVSPEVKMHQINALLYFRPSLSCTAYGTGHVPCWECNRCACARFHGK